MNRAEQRAVVSGRSSALTGLFMGFLLGCATPAAEAADLVWSLGGSAGNVLPLLGVNAGPYPATATGSPNLETHQSLGATLVRTQDFYGPLDMPSLYPDFTKDPRLSSSYVFSSPVGKSAGDQFNWSSDTVFSAMTAAGFEPFFRIGDSWNNVKPPANATERSNWSNAAVEVLRHYREGKWNGYQGSFRYVEIGNEPDNTATFWPAPRTATEFFQLYELTAKAVRSAFPTLKIGGPGITHAACTTTTGKAWTTAFLDYVKANAVPLDFLSWHIYSNDPAVVASCARYYRDALDARGFTATESIVSEWHTDTYGLSVPDAVAVRSMGRGAALTTAHWIKLQENGVNQSLIYRVSDPNPAPPDFYGLFDANQSAKRTALAFRLWSVLSGYSRRLTTTLTTGSSSELYALGAQNTQGGYAVLVANTGKSAKTWNLRLPDGSSPANWSLTLVTVSDALTANQVSGPDGSDLTAPAESMQLLVINPAGSTVNATATADGGASSLSLAARVKPASADVGKAGKVYIAAQSGGNFYFLANGAWQPWTGGTLPAYFSGTLPASIDATLLSRQDIRALGGTQIYAGYGLSEADMLNNSRYRMIYTLPAN